MSQLYHKRSDLAERLFDSTFIKNEVEEELGDIPFDRIGWDSYDGSLELYEVDNDYRLTDVDAFNNTIDYIPALDDGFIYMNSDMAYNVGDIITLSVSGELAEKRFVIADKQFIVHNVDGTIKTYGLIG